MRSDMVRLNEKWRAEALEAGQKFIEVHVGMGLNSGICCVGNMGSDQKFNYSVLGDDVNLASRLEGQSKTYGVDIVIGEKTCAEVPMLATLELDLIRVKGKTQPVHIHALVGDEAVAGNPAFVALKAKHEAMLVAYRRCDWAEATRLIELCRAEAPELMQKFYTLYEERIADYQAEPPPEAWDGVYVALTK